ncbi:GRAM domain-containing protein [Fusobacterium sp.]|uniref:GRAM domain-containing protein n=1 Tax=Fusobacterium sp. TaxID=68766 RepID=UPI00261CEDEC|nr:GRAM domain-containing protein [Fusobacterium sp.]
MAEMKLIEGEELLIKKQVSHIKTLLVVPQPNPGNLFITNKRVVFTPTQGRSSSAFEYKLEEIASFSVGLMNTITLLTKDGEKHKLSGLFNKSIIEVLEKINITREK